MSEDSQSAGRQKKVTTFKIEPEAIIGLEDHDWIVPVEEPETEEVDEEAKNRREVLRSELAAMTVKDENAKARLRAKKEEAKRKAIEESHKERQNKGFTILPGTVNSKRAIRKVVRDEEVVALEDTMQQLHNENDKIQSYIDDKLGISTLPKGDDLVALADDFYNKAHTSYDYLPDHVRAVLTTDEISDLRKVFELFDAKNKGYITAQDLKKVAEMLGFTAKRQIFKEMIDTSPTSKKGRVTFAGFLDLVVKLQGDGPDPYEDMKQFFNLLDKEDKGYVTFKDIRSASDELKIPLSNNAIRDMMSEADPHGDGKIRLENLVKLLGQSATFRAVATPPSS